MKKQNLPLKETPHHRWSINSAEEVLSDKDTDIEEEVINKILIKTVLEAIMTLDEEEKWLIQELFFYGKSEVVLSQETGVARTTLQSKKYKAFEKIKKIMKIWKKFRQPPLIFRLISEGVFISSWTLTNSNEKFTHIQYFRYVTLWPRGKRLSGCAMMEIPER